MKLIFFDFDDTLFKTPNSEWGREWWKDKTGEEFPGGDWWKQPQSLDNNVFQIEIINSVYDKWKYHKESGDYVILLTGRVETLRNEVENILELNNLEFDEILLKPNGVIGWDFKSKTVLDKIEEINPSDVIYYDDRKSHIDKFKKLAKDIDIPFTIVDVVNNKEWVNRRIRTFESYVHLLNEEFSKNDPIPELNIQKNLGIVLLGAPGSGKSYFAKTQIMNKQSNIKSFSTDYVSLKFTGDPNVYHPTASYLNVKYLKNYMNTCQNFIYDATGVNDKDMFDVCKRAKEKGYNLIFILILIDLESAKKQNIKRGKEGGHLVPEDYIDFVYNKQLYTTKMYLKSLHYENFYIVHNRGTKYKYYKHGGDMLYVRKVDKYVPAYKTD